MALNSLFCDDVPLRNYSLTFRLEHCYWLFTSRTYQL